jgi:hypothetical protein
MIIEYKLDAGERGSVIPPWVKDGGYYRDPDNFTMVGWTNDAPRKFKIPDTVLVLDKAALTNRVLNLHSRYPLQKDDGEEMVDMINDEITAQVSAWYDKMQG